MIEIIIGITVMAIMNGGITTGCGYQAKPFAVPVHGDGRLAWRAR
jgi:hypothetical protein